MGRAVMLLLVDLLEDRRPQESEIALEHKVIMRASSGLART
jgi:DNA-binding LacI/PurR family transcriptional regulator